MGCSLSSQKNICPYDLPSRRTFSEPSVFGSSIKTESELSDLELQKVPSYEEVCREKLKIKLYNIS